MSSSPDLERGLGSLPPGARCALHPDLAARATCARCGNFMCAGCASERADALCPGCGARLPATGRFPYSREDFTLDGLLNLALARFKEQWTTLVLVFGAFFVVTYGASTSLAVGLPLLFPGALTDPWFGGFTHPAFIVGQLLQISVQVAGLLAVFGVCLDVLESRPLALSATLARLRRLPEALLQVLIVYAVFAAILALPAGAGWWWFRQGFAEQQLWIFLGALVLTVAPITYVSLGCMYGTLTLVHDPEAGPVSALRDSWTLVSGKRWSVLAIGLVAGVIVLAGFLACCIGVVASTPVATLLYCALFLALRNTRPADDNG